jgi:two-component system chemotaxis response regulator CheB
LPADTQHVPSPLRRIVLCEDSRTYATALTRALEHDGSLSVVGVFPTAERALEELPRLKPDLVTMDLELPGMSGLDAVEQIMASTPTPVVVISAHTESRSATADAALAAGAVATIPKSEVDVLDPAGLTAIGLRRRLARLSTATVVRHPIARLARAHAHAEPTARRRLAAVGIVASTGGPKAVERLLRSLPGSFPVPVLVVQHIAASFTDSLVRTLDRSTDLPVALAQDGMRLARGVWVAPAGANLELRPGRRLALVPGGDEPHCPSGDALLSSLARMLGSEAVGVVLTGMGRDGAAGVQELVAAGGLAIAEKPASAVVDGMPRAALRSGAAIGLEPSEIGRLLVRMHRGPERAEKGIVPPSIEGRRPVRLVR